MPPTFINKYKICFRKLVLGDFQSPKKPKILVQLIFNLFKFLFSRGIGLIQASTSMQKTRAKIPKKQFFLLAPPFCFLEIEKVVLGSH